MNPYIGEMLGPYQIVAQIGQGGMATVFKAYQPSMDRYVALKVLPSHFTQDETFVARFNQEARTLARLEHPHILPVYDYGEHEGITYLVMRYVEAGTLRDLIEQKGVLDLAQVVHILGQVGRALGYAHSQGVIHRDVKPSNVLIDQLGNAFLTDFGIAKLVAGSARFTGSGVVIGTPAYMSPEQGLGKPVDHRCDIYALGVMLYEMLVGQVPYDAETPLAVLMKHVSAPLPPPRQLRPDLPEVFERIALKALAKVPEARFQTAERMAEMLERAIAGLPTEIILPQATAVLPQVGGPTAVMPSSATAESLIQGPAADFSAVESLSPSSADPEPVPADTRVTREPRRFKLPRWLLWGLGGVAVLAFGIFLTFSLLDTLQNSSVDEPPPGVVTSMPGWTNYSNGNFVYALAQRHGYLWVGGAGQLLRWDLDDGSYLKVDMGGDLAFDVVNALLVDQDDNLWVATDQGLGFLNGDTWKIFTQVDGLDTDHVISLFEDADGGLWAGTAYGERGLNYYDGESWGAAPPPSLPLEFPYPRVIVADGEQLFVGLDEHGLARFDGAVWKVWDSESGLPGDQIDALLLLDETLFVSVNYEVLRFDLASEAWELVPQLSGHRIFDIYRSYDERLWFLGESGVISYDPKFDDWEILAPDLPDVELWSVSSMLELDDSFCFGTHTNGLVFYDDTHWDLWMTGDQLASNEIFQILPEPQGRVWFMHSGTGLSLYDPASDAWQTFDSRSGALDWLSFADLDDQGRLWIGGYDELKYYDGQRWQTYPLPFLDGQMVHAVACGPDEVKWLWTDEGLLRYDAADAFWEAFGAADVPVLAQVSALLITESGRLWVGGEAGLVYYEDGVWRTPPGEEMVELATLAEAADGTLWLIAEGALYSYSDSGGYGPRIDWPGQAWLDTFTLAPDGTLWAGSNGVGHLDPVNGVWQIFTTADGLVHNHVTAIHVAPDDSVWIATRGGVSRYSPQE